MNSDTKLEATLLATTLSKLGHKCSADAVEWAYADSENAALLRWIARELLGDSVSVLTEEEADAWGHSLTLHAVFNSFFPRFAELVAANPGLVDSDGNVAKPYRENAHSLEHELDEEVERDIAILQQELKELESFSALLEKQENDFGLTTQILADKIHHYAQEDEIVSEHIAKTSVVLENASLKVDVAMKELSEKIEAMISCAHSTKEETLIGNCASMELCH
ncbi:hypothetical protein BC830DRAFT_1174754 [Chytriomyces sp. MP71]|nr:hypothetical protein BC830DRAFT_1174754 [Chytriomyces sp. MP71]